MSFNSCLLFSKGAPSYYFSREEFISFAFKLDANVIEVIFTKEQGMHLDMNCFSEGFRA